MATDFSWQFPLTNISAFCKLKFSDLYQGHPVLCWHGELHTSAQYFPTRVCFWHNAFHVLVVSIRFSMSGFIFWQDAFNTIWTAFSKCSRPLSC